MTYHYREHVDLSLLVGEEFTSVRNTGDEIVFERADGTGFVMYHSQDCCESVRVEEVIGDLADLVNTPILEAREDTDTGTENEEWGESYTWTFYNIRTIKGSVTIRWYGTSNGYYSERVSFARWP